MKYLHGTDKVTVGLVASFMLLPSVALAQSKTLNNPLAFPTITELLQAILNIVIVVSLPIVALFIIYAGFLYVTAQGNPEKLQQASRALLYGIIGGVIIIGSVAILTIIENLVAEF